MRTPPPPVHFVREWDGGEVRGKEVSSILTPPRTEFTATPYIPILETIVSNMAMCHGMVVIITH